MSAFDISALHFQFIQIFSISLSLNFIINIAHFVGGLSVAVITVKVSLSSIITTSEGTGNRGERSWQQVSDALRARERDTRLAISMRQMCVLISQCALSFSSSMFFLYL